MLNLSNASILSYNQTSQFFGESFRYQNQKSLTVEGVVRDVGNTEGVSGIQSGINDLFSTDEDYSSVIINGYDFGQGKITSINFSEGNDVRLKSYSASIICYETGNLFNLSGAYYSGIAPSSGNRYDLIDNLSEVFSYNRDGETYGYTHNVSLKLNSGNGLLISPIDLAKSFAASLIASNVPLGELSFEENQDIGFKIYNESYNIITNQCSFTETYTRPKNTSGFLFTRTNSFNLGSDGIAVVGENGSVKNISGNLNMVNFNKLPQLVDSIVSGSYSRCNELFTDYSDIGAHPLYTGYLSYSQSLNHFANTAEYNISYTNDPSQISGCSWSFTNEIEKDGRYYNVRENGNIVGHGVPQNDGYFRAKNFYQGVRENVFARNYGVYTGYVGVPLTLKRVGENSTSSQFDGSVQYGFTFSDNPVHNDGVSGVKTREINATDSIPTRLLNKFEIYNVAEIVQPQDNSTLGNRSLSIDFSLTKDHSYQVVKEYARATANEYIPTGQDVFVNSLQYNYSPVEKKFALNAAWTFQRDAAEVI